MSTREATRQARATAAVVDRGGWITKVHQTGYGRRGIPDLIGTYKGRFLAIEVKGDRAQLTPEQAHQLWKVREAGGISFIYGPGMPTDTVERVLDLIDQGATPEQIHLVNRIPDREVVRL